MNLSKCCIRVKGKREKGHLILVIEGLGLEKHTISGGGMKNWEQKKEKEKGGGVDHLSWLGVALGGRD